MVDIASIAYNPYRSDDLMGRTDPSRTAAELPGMGYMGGLRRPERPDMARAAEGYAHRHHPHGDARNAC